MGSFLELSDSRLQHSDTIGDTICQHLLLHIYGLLLPQHDLACRLHANLDSAVNPATPAVRPVRAGEQDVSVRSLEGREIFCRGVRWQIAPSAPGKLVIVPIMGNLGNVISK